MASRVPMLRKCWLLIVILPQCHLHWMYRARWVKSREVTQSVVIELQCGPETNQARSAASIEEIDGAKSDVPPRASRLIELKILQTEEIFTDFWLDALNEPFLKAFWPKFIVGELRKGLASDSEWILIEELLVPFGAPSVASTGSKSVTEEERYVIFIVGPFLDST